MFLFHMFLSTTKLKVWRLLVLAALIGILVVIQSPQPVQAANCLSTGSGLWTDSIWTGCTGSTPNPGDTVTIAGGTTVILNISTAATALTIQSGGALVPDNPASVTTRTLNVSGYFINNGTFTAVNGNGRIDVTISGLGEQRLVPGTAIFNNLTLGTTENSLAGYWKFDEGSGTTATDSSGTGNVGTLVGGLDWTTTTASTVFSNSNALNFDGTAGKYVSIPNSSSLNFNPANNFTLLAWIRSNIVGNQPDGTGIIVKGDNGAEQYALDINANGYLRFTIRNGSGTPTSVVASSFGAITSAKGWVHVAAIVDFGSNVITLYVNSYDGTTTYGTPPTSLLSNSHLVSIGSRQSGSTDYDRTFNGLIDEVRIYGRAIGGDEVLRLYRGWVANAVELGSPLSVNGNLTLNGTALDATEPGNYAMNLAGNLINNCCLQARFSTLTFTGAGVHTIIGNAKFTRFYNLTIPDATIVEAGAAPITVVNTLNLGTGLGQLRRTPSTNTSNDCSATPVTEKDATNNTTVTLAGCNNFTTATIRTAQAGMFPNVDLTGSPKYDTCPASSNLVQRYWQITPNGSGTRTATVTFYYLPGELNGNSTSALHVLKCSGGIWVDQGLATHGTSGSYNTATLSGVLIGSGYALGPVNPTAVKLSSFKASTDSLTIDDLVVPSISLMVGLSAFVLGGVWWILKSRRI